MTRLLFVDQLRLYGFQSYEIERISIDRQTYRPSIDGVELGITSASDAIRLVWAYLVSLLELSRLEKCGANHLGLLIFDEPKQQMVADISFQSLMYRAAESKAAGQQVIFATSQKAGEIERMMVPGTYEMINFDDWIIKRIEPTSSTR